LLVSGCAGVGKSTIIAALRASMPERIVIPSITATARLPWLTADVTDVVPEETFESFVKLGCFVYHVERRGVRWGLLAVEEHPMGVEAARRFGLAALVAHVVVPNLDTMDQRLRMSSKQYEEQEVQ
jgi:hypothetical protein